MRKCSYTAIPYRLFNPHFQQIYSVRLYKYCLLGLKVILKYIGWLQATLLFDWVVSSQCMCFFVIFYADSLEQQYGEIRRLSNLCLARGTIFHRHFRKARFAYYNFEYTVKICFSVLLFFMLLSQRIDDPRSLTISERVWKPSKVLLLFACRYKTASFF